MNKPIFSQNKTGGRSEFKVKGHEKVAIYSISRHNFTQLVTSIISCDSRMQFSSSHTQPLPMPSLCAFHFVKLHFKKIGHCKLNRVELCMV